MSESMKFGLEEMLDAGDLLVRTGQWLQRHYPKAERIGSQQDEDEVIAALLPEQYGIYVDIGAHHPQECSNTWKLYQRGWRGLLIEPLPDCWGNLLLERREDRLVPVACSNVSSISTLRLCRSISSLEPEWKSEATEAMPVRTAPLSKILSLYKDHDWSKTRLCSIDVEGHERQVLEGFPWSYFKPKVIVIEYRDYNPVEAGNDVSGNWMKILLKQGYAMQHQNSLNQIWVSK